MIIHSYLHEILRNMNKKYPICGVASNTKFLSNEQFLYDKGKAILYKNAFESTLHLNTMPQKQDSTY